MKKVITVATLLAILSIPSQSFAYNLMGNKFSDKDFYYTTEGSFPEDYPSALNHAVFDWNDTNTPIHFMDFDSLAEVTFVAPAFYGNVYWAGLANMSFTPGQYYDHATVEINRTWVDYYDFDRKKAVFSHEMGHVMGLAHVTDASQIMYGSGVIATKPGSDDIAGINYLYGRLNSNIDSKTNDEGFNSNDSNSDDESSTIDYHGLLAQTYKNIDELKEDADLVLEIEATDSNSLEYKNVVFTLIDAKVKKAFTADKNFKDNEIKILETGGQYEDKNYLFEGNEVLKEGDKTIVFLKKYEGPIADDAYVILGAYQGKFNLDKNGKIKENKKLEGRLSEINNITDLQLEE